MRGWSVGCTLGMSDISLFRVLAVLNVHREFSELKKKHFEAGAAGFHVYFFRFFLRTHTACCKYEVALPHLPLC